MAVPNPTEPLPTSPRRMLPLDVEVQIEQLAALGVAADHSSIDRGFSGTRRDGLNPRGGQLAGRSPDPVVRARASGAVAVLLAEHLHLGVGVVDVDGDVVELLDELLEVLRLELGEVDRYP